MRRMAPVSLLVVAALSTSACATVTRGNSEDVVFTSAPTGAKVSTITGLQCRTPCTLDIKRRQKFKATFQHGGETRVIDVDSRVGGAGIAAGAGNVLAGGVIGIAVDASSGATLEHLPNPVHADFSKPQSQAQAHAEAHAKAVVVAQSKAQADKQKAKNPGQDPNS